jgi:hypothetical protein
MHELLLGVIAILVSVYIGHLISECIDSGLED